MYIIDQTITIEVLKYMKAYFESIFKFMKPKHVVRLLKNYTLGVQLKFKK